jgi:hypothetical protein
MALSAELIDAVEGVLRLFYRNPSQGLSRWVQVDDGTGQTLLALLKALIDRNMDQRSDIVVRDIPAFVALTKLVVQPPWCSFFSFDTARGTLSVSESVEEQDLRQMAELMNAQHKAIE